MNKNAKRLLSLFLCLMLVLSVLPLAALAADTTLRVYCQAPDGWSKCYAYWWGNAVENTSWPGTAMTADGDGIWYIDIPANASNIIFNNGSGTQSADLVVPTDDKVMFVYETKVWDVYGRQEIEISYYVAGTFNGWDPAAADYKMTAGSDGIYTLDVTVSAGANSLKVTDGSWNNSWGGDGAYGNYDIVAATDGTITITFDSVSNTVTVDGDCLDGVVLPPVFFETNYYVAGTFNGWNCAAKGYQMTAGEKGIYTLDIPVSSGNHSLKITDSTWANSWGGTGENGNYDIEVVTDGSITVTFDSVNGTVIVTGDCLVGSVETNYYVGGSFNLWNCAAEGYQMIAGEKGIYTLDISVTTGSHSLKVTDGTWDNSWGGTGENGNYDIKVVTDGSITVTFDSVNGIVTVTGDCLEEIVQDPLEINTIHAVGDVGMTGAEWDTTANEMTGENGVYTITFTGIAAGTYEFKFAANGTWAISWGTGVAMESNVAYDAWFNGGNCSVFVAEDDSTVTLSLDMTAMDSITGEGVTCTVTVKSANTPTGATVTLGDNALSLAGGDVDGEIWTYTATETGTLSINVTALSYDDGTGVFTEVLPEAVAMVMSQNYNTQIDQVSVYDFPYEKTVAAGDVVTVHISNHMGTATELTMNLSFKQAVLYFDNSLYNWENVNIYAWNDNGAVSQEWPGTAMARNEDGLWRVELPGIATKVIFNNGTNQTTEHIFTADTVYNGVDSAPYGTELSTSLYVTGSGALGDWDAANAPGLMTNNGDGTFSVTIKNVPADSYEYKITAGNWDHSWGIDGGNYALKVTAFSNVTIIFDLNTAAASAEVQAVPLETTIKLCYPTISLEDVIVMNVYYSVTNLENIAQMGLITYSEKVADYSVETAESVISGYAYSEVDGLYYVSSNGIAAKDLGDSIYFAVYAQMVDGSYVYTSLVNYSPETYAYNQLKSGIQSMKPLMVAMLNYAAAAQNYFNYNTDALVNADLTADQLALIEPYHDGMVAAVPQPDAAKLGTMVNNGGYIRRYPTISFEGAFCINYYFVPSATVAGDVTMYVWKQADYDAVKALSTDNATAAIPMTLTDTGEYVGTVAGIAAKDLDQGAYVSFCYSDGTTDYCSGVVGYSIGLYCKAQAAKTGSLADLSAACAVYSYYAKQLFA